jgi:hypothetical protein
MFADADVRLSPDALARIAGLLERRGLDLVSGFPQEVTRTLSEALIVPLIHVLLLGYLPIWLARRLQHPAFAAGCGQLIAVGRDAYQRAGGHAAIRGSRHDGLMLPRAFRRAGCATDLFDATDLARCRMYRGDGRSGKALRRMPPKAWRSRWRSRSGPCCSAAGTSCRSLCFL